MLPKIANPQGLISGRGFLMIATLIFGAANAVTRKLHDLGDQNLIAGRNPISFCNSLFVGNLCALIILTILYHREWHWAAIRRIKLKTWLLLTVVAVLSGALAPALIFTALDQTMVNNVILVGRIEPPLALALSVWLLKAKTNIWVVAGAIAAFIGVALTILLQSSGGVMFGKGELLTAIAAVALAIASIITKVQLTQISLGIFSVFRMGIGTLVFGTIVIWLFGFQHFADVLSPFLWQWMLIYSLIIVVGGQLCWFMGITKSSSADVTLASSFNPLAGILGSYVILGQAPNMAQYVGGIFIMVGIGLGLIGARLHQTGEMPSAIAMDMKSGFKGV